MKLRIAHFLLFLVLAALVGMISGCASTEPENASVRPWDAPADWQQNGALGGMDYQHR
jgi:hypothetical protein